ncbi:MAG: hypothetical protein A2W03_18355 [Candidatus Aminicenantes bacterium RBG_16_63_16]|nr:MAG: hypothetical protein A2W03_18355 [Candidatus Aminicenantes bacterium RBG_16_63_16]
MSRSSGRLLAFVAAASALAVLLCACAREDGDGRALLMSSDFESETADGWRPKDPGSWRVVDDGGSKVYELAAAGAQGSVRAPTSWSLWEGREASSFEFSGRLRCYTDPSTIFRDMCVFFHFQDPTHFYYVHFAGTSDGVHNIIGLVNGADRVKINAEPAGASVFRLTDRAWHAFKVVRDAATGEIRAYLDDMETPILTARDRTLGRGLVGVGSFDDTGAFDDLALRAPAR